MSEIKEIKSKIESMSVDLPKGIGDMIDFRLIYRVKGQSKLFSPKIDKNKSGIIPMFEYLNYKNKIVVPFDSLVCVGNYVKGVSMAEMFNSLNNEFIDEDANTKNNPLSSFNLKAYQKEQIIEWYNEIKNKIILIERLEALKEQENEQKEA
tara:strand:- start:7001 stop:7453 length:453 start_codon:yes stop_codon:yes gene_type:complete